MVEKMKKKAFKSESKRLLDLMINSIYTNKEIFLRELISNASDALDKLYYQSLTDKKLKVKREELEINITYDKENRILTIEDNGIGMTEEELEHNLGTIAQSGSLKFKENLSKQDKIDIIGQFGVGFYSAFMVSDCIEVTTKSATAKEKNGWHWISTGVDGYSIEACDKKTCGTKISLHLKPDTEDENYSQYLEEYELKELIKKYSDYIRYPIKMKVTKQVLKDQEKNEYEEKEEIETINSMIPLWKRNPKEVTEEDYNHFYMDKFNDFDKPLKVITTSVEGLCSYKGLLFIPSHAPYDFYTKDYEKGLSLYASGVLIMEKCSDLLPDYFSFVKGVVDTEDLSLNISREMLQKSKSLNLIAKNIESKIRKELETMLKEDRETYESFFNTFGMQLKYGVYDNYGRDKDKLQDLIMFYSSKREKLVTLKEYVEHMKEGQEKIYYATGNSISKIDSLPQVEQVKEKDYDILYLTDYIDEFVLSAIHEYEKKAFVNIEKDDLDLGTEEEKEETKKVNEENNEMLKEMQKTIEEVQEVRFTNKLKSHPVCLTSVGEISIEMQKVFEAMPNTPNMKAQTVLEINEKHPIVNKLKDLYQNDKETFEKYTKILYSEARMIAGLPIENPTEVSNLICDVIAK